MLHLRLATSAVLISVLSGLLYLDYRYPTAAIFLIPALMFFAIGTSIDVTNMLRGAEHEVNALATRIGVAVMLLIACVPMFWQFSGAPYPADCSVGKLGWFAVGAMVALLIALAVEMWTYNETVTGATRRLQAASFVILYVGVPMAFLIAVRGLGTPHWGLAAMLSLIAVTKIADAGAYFTGRAIGRHKLIPRLSPGKTIEGALGGIAASIGLSYAAFGYLMPAITGGPIAYPWWGPIVFGFVCAVCGMFGDLAESLIKRDTGVKDSGNLLPGLGGVWDVTDSLIGTALPGYLCLVAGVAGTVA